MNSSFSGTCLWVDLGPGHRASGLALGHLNEKFQGFANKPSKKHDSTPKESLETMRAGASPPGNWLCLQAVPGPSK